MVHPHRCPFLAGTVFVHADELLGGIEISEPLRDVVDLEAAIDHRDRVVAFAQHQQLSQRLALLGPVRVPGQSRRRHQRF